MRSLKVALLVAFAAFVTPASAQEKASLRLNWYLGGSHAMYYLGVERGTTATRGSTSRSTRAAARRARCS